MVDPVKKAPAQAVIGSAHFLELPRGDEVTPLDTFEPGDLQAVAGETRVAAQKWPGVAPGGSVESTFDVFYKSAVEEALATASGAAPYVLTLSAKSRIESLATAFYASHRRDAEALDSLQNSERGAAMVAEYLHQAGLDVSESLADWARSEVDALFSQRLRAHRHADDLFPAFFDAQPVSAGSEHRVTEATPPTHLPIDALESITDAFRPSGAAFELGTGTLGDRRRGPSMNVNVRAISHEHEGHGFEINFDLRDRSDVIRLQQALLERGGEIGKFEIEEGTFHDGRRVFGRRIVTQLEHDGEPRTVSLKRHAELSVDVLNAFDETMKGAGRTPLTACSGRVRIRVYGSGKTLALRLEEVLSMGGLALSDGEAHVADKIARINALSMRLPATASAVSFLALREIDDAELDSALRVVKRSRRQLLRVEPAPGYVTWYDPEEVALYRKLGVSSLYHTLSSKANVIKILAGDGLLSTMERFSRGLAISGWSSSDDLTSGGADSVFLRAVTPCPLSLLSHRRSFTTSASSGVWTGMVMSTTCMARPHRRSSKAGDTVLSSSGRYTATTRSCFLMGLETTSSRLSTFRLLTIRGCSSLG
jgi:hypothetical protein